MKIVIEITHPAHVHFFRNPMAQLEERGHVIALTARDKDVTISLLESYGFPYEKLSGVGHHSSSLLKELLVRDVALWRFCRSFKPDVLTGIGGVFAAHVGFLIRRPVVIWDDTEHASLSHAITYPLATAIHSPNCYQKSFGKKHHRYQGCHELSYLHPSRFRPDEEVVKKIGIDPSETYCLVRFVGWRAHHDIGQRGFSREGKEALVRELSKICKVYINSEGLLPEDLEPYRLNIPVHDIHQVMAHAALCVSEGATMASESAVLGVPAVYVNTLKLGYIDMLENYGLVCQTSDPRRVMDFSLRCLNDSSMRQECLAARSKLLAETIDVSDYITSTIEKYQPSL